MINFQKKKEICIGRESAERRIFLSLIVPAFNEEKRLPDTLRLVGEYFSETGYEYEIIIVDDGSTDGTINAVKNMGLRSGNTRLLVNGANRGKGYSVKRGMMAAKGRYVIFSDADLSTPIEETGNLLRCIDGGYDISVASRGMPESDIRVHQPFYREFMGKAFNLFVRLFILKGIKDTQCGFKCFRGEIIREIFERQRMERFSFDVEILYIAKKLGYTIREVPVRWFNEANSRVSILRDSARMLFDLVMIRCNDILGLY